MTLAQNIEQMEENVKRYKEADNYLKSWYQLYKLADRDLQSKMVVEMLQYAGFLTDEIEEMLKTDLS